MSRTAVAALVSLGLLAGSDALAQRSASRLAFARLPEAEREAIQEAVGVAYLAVVDARAQIAAGNPSAARRETVSARKVMHLVNELSPSLHTASRIRRALARLTVSGGHRDLLVPIEQSLATYEVVASDKVTRGRIEKAKRHLAVGDAKGARVELEAAEAGLRYTEVDVPVQELAGKLDRASTQLADGDASAADATLESAETDLESIALSAQVDLAALIQ